MSRPLRLRGYLTLRQVAKALGQPWCPATRKTLTAAIKAKERLTGKRILFNLSQTGTCRRWLTTSIALEAAFPEWFPKRSIIAEMLQEELAKGVEHDRIQDKKLNALGARLRIVEKALALVAH